MLILNKRKSNLKILIYIFLCSVQLLIPLILYYLVPVLTNYPPFSEESNFILGLEPFTHVQQYLLMGTIYMIILLVFIKVSFKNIFIFLKKYSSQNDINLDFISKVRLQCLKIPTKYLLLQMFAAFLILIAVGTTINWVFYVILKATLVYISLFILINVISSTILKIILNQVISLTYISNPEYKDSLYEKTSFSKNIAVQLIPFLIAILGVVSMISYAKIVNEIGETNYQYYQIMTENIDNSILRYNNTSRHTRSSRKCTS